MTLQQMSRVKRWHLTHREGHRIELVVWDLLLTCWVIGLVGLPASAMLGSGFGLAMSVLAVASPTLYVALRTRLHRKHRLRCDWFAAALDR